MSQDRSMCGPAFTSELIHPAAVCWPQPQFSRVTCGSPMSRLTSRPNELAAFRPFASPDAEFGQQPAQHLVRVEVLLGDGPGRPAMAGVVAVDRFHTRRGLVDRREGQQAL